MQKTVVPSLAFDGGEGYEAAQLLLSPLRALLDDEMEAAVDLMTSSSRDQVMRALGAVEIPSLICSLSGMLTRHAGVSGVGEASEIMSLGSRYLDSNQIMPPEVALWKQKWYIDMLPDFAEDWADDVQDLYNKLMLKTSPEYTIAAPPSILGPNQGTGYRHAMAVVLRTNIQAYTDISKAEGGDVEGAGTTSTTPGTGDMPPGGNGF